MNTNAYKAAIHKVHERTIYEPSNALPFYVRDCGGGWACFESRHKDWRFYYLSVNTRLTEPEVVMEWSLNPMVSYFISNTLCYKSWLSSQCLKITRNVSLFEFSSRQIVDSGVDFLARKFNYFLSWKWDFLSDFHTLWWSISKGINRQFAKFPVHLKSSYPIVQSWSWTFRQWHWFLWVLTTPNLAGFFALSDLMNWLCSCRHKQAL